MYVPVIRWNNQQEQRTQAPRRLPDQLNAEVQELITQEIELREKFNKGLFAKIFGQRAIDRDSVLRELKAARVLDDDRYFIAAMSQRRVS